MRKLILAAIVGFIWKKVRSRVPNRRWAYPVAK
jgi:hypothetical protein